MNPLSLVVTLMASAILTAFGLPFVLGEIHSSRLSALEGDIGHVAKAAAAYGRANGSYSGISCPALASEGFWPANGCSGTDFLFTELPDTAVTVGSINPMNFDVNVSTAYYVPDDLVRVCTAWGPKTDSCASSPGQVVLTFQ
uniref:Uncharacterized protein n=1 Tax=Leptospirillum ferrodiazotrophum TaxID=412449 RepID=C6HTY1_9BACT|nr:MAG: hypothetical protein UBAL3_44810046 [Leptospirillum ferrodiazotrophum]